MFVVQVHQQLADANKTIAKFNTDREESLDVLPFTPVSSTCSSGMGDLSSAELHEQQEQQEIKPKKRRIRQVTIKQPIPKPLESNQTKRPRSNTTRAKSSNFKNKIFSLWNLIYLLLLKV